MKQLIEKVPSFFKNFYFLSGLFFVIWVALVDSNDLFTQVKLTNKYSELREEKLYYEDKILEVMNDKEALTNNPDLLEKIAREKYLMKKENEDLYIVVKE